jgi:hydroxyacylglutathione hydrolase
MFLQVFPSGPLFTNAYVVACDATKEAAIIDPAQGSIPAIQKFLNAHSLTCKHILLTHSHWDHIAEVSTAKELYNAPVYIHPLDTPNLEQPGSDGLPCALFIPSVTPDKLLGENTPVMIGDLTLQVIHTPGHSPGSVCFYVQNYGILISGDTLFRGAVGNLSFPTSKPELMKESLAKLAALPPQTKVYPGHGPITSLVAEHRTLRIN